jgi:molybdopterin adenylyltransferase
VTVTVITISDRASRGEYPDRSGPEIVAILRQAFPEARVAAEVVPDEAEAIVAAFRRHRRADFVLTTGGTGVSTRDVTPEATRGYCDRELPGIAEALRAESYKETANAVLSRAAAGIKDSTIIVNFPGSLKAVRLCTRVLIPVMEHALSMLHGGRH